MKAKPMMWKTEQVEYAYEDSIKASSDHAAVIGRFELKKNACNTWLHRRFESLRVNF